MRLQNPNTSWNAAQEEERWRALVDKAAASYEKFKHNTMSSQCEHQFSILCLAEFDAARQLRIPECCASRTAMISELKRLVGEPTNPSLPVASIEAYRASQNSWLEWLIQYYEGTDNSMIGCEISRD